MSDPPPADPDDGGSTDREARHREPRTDEAPAGEAPRDAADPDERRHRQSAAYDGPRPDPDAEPWKRPEEEWPDPEEDAPDLHPVLDAVADASVYLAIGSVALAIAGLAALALEFSSAGRTMIAVGIGGATVAMMLAAIIGAHSKGSVALTGPDT